MTNLSTLDYVENFTISKSLNDRMWKLEFTLDKDEAPTPMIGIRAFATDYADVEHCLFVGFIPGANYIRPSANNKVSITAYDFSWYLTAQYIPKEYWEVIGTAGTFDDSTVFELCGGDDWENITGTRFPTVQYGGCTNPGTFVWSPKTTKMEAIEEMAETCDKVWWTDFPLRSNVYICQAYYMPYANIDTSLPAEITFTSSSDYVIDLGIEERYLEEYNEVLCYGTNPETGDQYVSNPQSPGVSAGEEKPIQYVIEDAKLTTELKTITKAYALYDLLRSTSPNTYTATLRKRYDLRLLQKVKFSGYSDIPTDSMRIISITYNRLLNNDTVSITVTEDQAFTDMRLLARYLESDPIQQQQQVIEDKMNTGLAHMAIGEVTDVSGNVATLTLERSGNVVTARILV